MSEKVALNVSNVLRRIAEAARRVGRDPASVTLEAATKSQSAETVNAYLAAMRSNGVDTPVIGENYLQDFVSKREGLEGSFRAHYIGPIQRNKCKKIAQLFDVVESVGSQEVLDALHAAALGAERQLTVFLQVNISADEGKQGFSPDETRSILMTEAEKGDRRVHVVGLMSITRFYDTPGDVRPDFQELAALRDSCSTAIEKPLLLSMGMSRDYEVAVEEGADIVRVGSKLFGDREP